ncbi:MAG: molecular chaperone DnaJ [Sphingobium sp.]|nr:molecular chaperone DnaJ [Sphingobium sp.]
MTLAALLGALLLWLTFGGKALRDKRNWPGFAGMLIGLIFLAKAKPLVGLALIAAGIAWLKRPKRRKVPARPFVQDMAIAEAFDLLGLTPAADRQEIIAAHRRLITRNHPDSGGTEALAARLNAARDLLLKQTVSN